MHTAVHTKNAEMVKLLLERDDIDVNIKAIFQYIINTVLKNIFFSFNSKSKKFNTISNLLINQVQGIFDLIF